MNRDMNSLQSLFEGLFSNTLKYVQLLANDSPITVQEIQKAKVRLKIDHLGKSDVIGGSDEADTDQYNYDNVHSYAQYDPRISLIEIQLSKASNLLEFYINGEWVSPIAFRLINLEKWACHQSSSILENFGSIGSNCNCNCEFCYIVNKLPWSKGQYKLSPKEVKTRLKYFDEKNMTGLPIARREQVEPFMNPNFLEFLEYARAKELKTPFSFPTNGSLLREKVIKKLSELKPIQVHISLNSSDPSVREKVMKDPQPEVAIEAVKLLRKYSIKFVGSIVPWPTIPKDDIKRTIRYLDKYDAYLISLILPGYTKFHENISSTDKNKIHKRWNEIPDLVKKMREEVDTPILLYPTAYWQKETLTIPLIDGVIRNSPAYEAGLQAGDKILKIDGERVYSKSQAKSLLKNSNEDSSCLTLRRADKEFQVKLRNISNKKHQYPYHPEGYPSTTIPPFYGIKLVDSFSFDYINKLVTLIKKHDAQKILLVTSKLMKPVFLQTLSMSAKYSNFLKNVDFRTVVLVNDFWGGNIVLGDLYTVQEISSEIEKIISSGNFEPEIIVIPTSFTNKWGLDLVGDSFRELEYKLDIPVKKLKCKRIIQ